MTIPNLITIGRLLLVPLIVWLTVTEQHFTAFIAFLVAGISDGVDGFLARQFDLRTELGAYLDPLADKALLVSIYVVLAIMGEIPLWVTMAVVSRDVLIVGGVVLAWMMARPMRMAPLAISKINTLAQILLAAIVLGDLAFTIDLSFVRLPLVYIAGFLTVVSAAVYVVSWVGHMGGVETRSAARDRRKQGRPAS
ncbi:MAG: CDP-alcohol phosphatidyltransferase family protein [Alphaproteobacteria bacterium]